MLGAVADYGYQKYQSWHNGRYGDYSGTGSGTVHFMVPAGAALSELGQQLMKAGVIKEVRPFVTAANGASNAGTLQPGVYLLHHHMSSASAVTYLLNVKNRIKDQITITEGMRASAIADLLAKQTHLPVSQFTDIIDHPPASLGIPSWSQGKTAEGFLFPDTYTLLPHESALQILKTMVSDFNTQIAKINLTGEAQKVFTTPWHALIVASLVQAEAGRPSDFAQISRVTWNRLAQNMKLQYDSTVFYGLGIYGTAANSQQIKSNSPYNTYAHAGLPPGPIGNPGVAAMQAAVHPVKGNILYFITTPGRSRTSPTSRPVTPSSSSGSASSRTEREPDRRSVRAAVLGSPIGHSLSPVLHRAAYAALGLTWWHYDAIECDEAGLPALLDRLGPDWAGLSLTMPLKRTVLPLLDRVESLATSIGCANTVVFAAAPAARIQHRCARHGQRAGRARYRPGHAAGRARAHRRRRSHGLRGLGALSPMGEKSVAVAVRDPARATDLLAPRSGWEYRSRSGHLNLPHCRACDWSFLRYRPESRIFLRNFCPGTSRPLRLFSMWSITRGRRSWRRPPAPPERWWSADSICWCIRRCARSS